MKENLRHVLDFIPATKPIRRVELQKALGDNVKRKLVQLKNEGLVKIDSGFMVSLTLKGRCLQDPAFCSGCECNPCDCGWGN